MPVSSFSSNLIETIFNEDAPLASEDVQHVLKCIAKVNFEKGSDLTTGDILECVPEWRAEDEVLGVNGKKNFINFVLKARGTSEVFQTGNSYLKRGNWIYNNRKVPKVDGVRILHDIPATFSVRGEKSSCEGNFTIHHLDEVIANVTFNIPSKGLNVFKIKHYVEDYRCTARGFKRSGSPTVRIECGSTWNIGETEENEVKNSADDRVAPKFVLYMLQSLMSIRHSRK